LARSATAALRLEWPYRVRHDRSLSRWTPRAIADIERLTGQYLAAAGAVMGMRLDAVLAMPP
jgi:hypothetical protein